MKKTISISISQLMFHVEEDGFMQLSRYLQALRKQFQHEEGGDEIMHDIEARIAEIFAETLSDHKQIITLEDVEKMMLVMGKPEEFVEMEGEYAEASEEPKEKFKPGQRLYRDDENRVVAGVCSGLAAYFGISDPIWVRLIFIITILTGGWGTFIYLILWAFVPAAKTAAEKLAMKGESITIFNIEKTVKERIHEFEARLTQIQETPYEKWDDRIKHAIQIGVKVIEKGAKLLSKLIVIFVKGIFALFSFTTFILFLALLTTFIVGSFIIGPKLEAFFLSSSMPTTSGFISFLVFLSIPFMLAFLAILRTVFRVKMRKGPIEGLGIAVMIIASIFFFRWATVVASNFSAEARIEESIASIQPRGEVLHIKADEILAEEEVETIEGQKVMSKIPVHNTDGPLFSNNLMWLPLTKVSIRPSEGSEFKVEHLLISRGETQAEAEARAREIRYHLAQENDSTLVVNPHYAVHRNDKFRAQQVVLVMHVPIGKSVKLDPSIKRFLNPTEKVEGYVPESEFFGHVWTMTEDGLIAAKENVAGIN